MYANMVNLDNPDKLKHFDPETATKKAQEFFVFTVIGMLTLILVTSSIESQQRLALAATFKPDFSGTKLGKACSAAWDRIKELRNKANNGGTLSDDEKWELDHLVERYNVKCRDVFGGDPRLSGETSVVHNPSGGIVEPGPKTPKNPDVGSNTGTVEHGQKTKNNIPTGGAVSKDTSPTAKTG
jgi:hypothetical protein